MTARPAGPSPNRQAANRQVPIKQIPARHSRAGWPGLLLTALAMAAVLALTIVPRGTFGFLSAAPAAGWNQDFQPER